MAEFVYSMLIFQGVKNGKTVSDEFEIQPGTSGCQKLGPPLISHDLSTVFRPYLLVNHQTGVEEIFWDHSLLSCSRVSNRKEDLGSCLERKIAVQMRFFCVFVFLEQNPRNSHGNQHCVRPEWWESVRFPGPQSCAEKQNAKSFCREVGGAGKMTRTKWKKQKFEIVQKNGKKKAIFKVAFPPNVAWYLT